MATPAIKVTGLGKRYRLTRGQQRYGYRTLRDSLAEMARTPFRKKAATEEFWALEQVDFEVQPGELIGIVGRNGAGKSTLLKILSRITKPTRGRVEINGRVGSLLEVGTGFHPELTGRENIYLNGSILGMSQKEISLKFDEIVAFAEVEKFLDTPVKRYSSGMYVRLAFAVAAHLEPEILVVDEVLAVGDMAFQRKCMQRMKEVGQGGRTILFVSHNMAAIERLCTRAILLDQGRSTVSGDVPTVVREYNKLALAAAGGGIESPARDSNGVIRKLSLLNTDGSVANYLTLGGTCLLQLELNAAEELPFPVIGLGFDDMNGQRLMTIHTPLAGTVIERLAGQHLIECAIPNFPIAPGDYWVKVAISSRNVEIESVERALFLTVTDGDAFGEGRGFTKGLCTAPSHWRNLSDS